MVKKRSNRNYAGYWKRQYYILALCYDVTMITVFIALFEVISKLAVFGVCCSWLIGLSAIAFFGVGYFACCLFANIPVLWNIMKRRKDEKVKV
jgi:hypothetical protein